MTMMKEYALMALVGWASGISLYLTVALVGIGGRMGLLDLPASLEIFTHPIVIGVALLVYAVEFFADKVPVVDSVWDSVHTFVRPVGSAALAFTAGTEYGPAVQTTMAMMTGAITLDTHAVKSSSRLAINASPEPVSNVVVSVAEDTAVVMMFYFFTQHPIIATCIIIGFLVGSFFILRALWRFVLRLFGHKREDEITPAAPDPPPPESS